MAVEFDRALPADPVQRLEHHDRLLEPLRTDQRREIVVELRLDLRTEMQEFQLVHAAEVGNRHAGVHQRHRFVLQQLRIHAPEIGFLQLAADEAGRVSAGRQEHLAARFVRLRFDRRADIVGHVPFADVVGHMVQPFGQPLVDLLPLRDDRNLEAVARDPVDIVFRAEELPDAERALDLLRGEAADGRVRVAEPAVAEEPVSVQTADRSVDLHARIVEHGLDLPQLPAGGTGGVEVVFGVLRIPRHKVVVVVARRLDVALASGPGDDLRNLKRIEAGEHGASERIAQRTPHTPERHRTVRNTALIEIHLFFPPGIYMVIYWNIVRFSGFSLNFSTKTGIISP